MGSLLNSFDYEQLTFLDKRQEFLKSLIRTCGYSVSWIPIENEIARVINNMFKESKKDHLIRYTPEFQVYSLAKNQEEEFELSEPEFFDGLNFNKNWNTRDILLSEAVIEIEHKTDLNLNWLATMKTMWSLQDLNIHFAVFYAEGMRTPHIHIYDLFSDVQDWAEKEMAMAIFCRKVVPFEYFHLIDKNLWGQHTIALEFSKHYRTGHMLKLLYEYIPGVYDK